MKARTLGAVAGAMVAGGLALAAAPPDWEPGPAVIEISDDDQLRRSDVVLGDETPVDVPGELGFEAPQGFPTAGPIELLIEAPGRSLGDVEVVLEMGDGEQEQIPVISSDDGRLVAERRPPDDSGTVLALLAIAVVLWVTEAVPLFVTSLAIPVVLAVTGVGTAQEALAPFFDPIIVLFFAGFLMAEAMHRVGLDKLAAAALVSVFGRSPFRLYAGMLITSAFLSMWMSNTAAVTVLLPIALAVTDPLGDIGFRKACVLGIAYAATIGGVGSAIGTPANPLAITYLADLTGTEITFAEWFGFGLPMVVVFVPLMGLYLWGVSGVSLAGSRVESASEAASAQLAAAGPLNRAQVEVLAVFGLVSCLWLTQGWHDQHPGIVALGGAVVLFLLGRLEAGDLGRISWPTLLTFGGGLTLGTFMVSTGTSDWLVTRLGGLGGLPDALAIGVVALASLALTTVASNTAAAATLIPLAIPLAGLVGIDPVLLVAVVAIATSIDFALVIGTPPTMLAYSTGELSAGEILRKGLPLDLVGVAMLVLVVVPVWELLGVT